MVAHHQPGYDTRAEGTAGERYQDFIREASNALLEMPETVISSVAGAELLYWLPTRFEWIRTGARRFGLPVAQVYQDVMNACRSRRGTAVRAGFLRLVRFLGVSAPSLGWSFLRGSAAMVFGGFTARRIRGYEGSFAGAEAPPKRDDAPKVSVVILSFNRLSYLERTIRAFLETVDYPSYELIVVDNGSHDGSAKFLKDARSRGVISKLVLLQSNRGISAGYNHGFAIADRSTEFYMKLDSDIEILSRGWLAEVVRFLTVHRSVGLVALNQVNHPALNVLPHGTLDDTEIMDFGGWPCGSAMVIPRRVKQDIGCFVENPGMKYILDDVDYYQRVSRKGYASYYLRNLLVYHQLGNDWTKYIKKFSEYRRAMDFSVALAREYDQGVRPLEIHYREYEA